VKPDERITSVDEKALKLLRVDWIPDPKIRRATPLMFAAASGYIIFKSSLNLDLTISKFRNPEVVETILKAAPWSVVAVS